MYSKESIPFAPVLIESMRSIGYSFESAIADLLDNSISADANEIKITLNTEDDENPYITILDNGKGMGKEKLEEAMRYGSKNPNDKREENDLGRFGLGMKSASLSQCRKMVVISKNKNQVSAFSWDLNNILKTNSWVMIGYEENEIKKFPGIGNLMNLKSGTYIYLEDFDRIRQSTNNLNKTLENNIVHMESHIALVFHRFIEEGLKIFVNNNEIEARDPFLLQNKKTQHKREQTIKIEGEKINVKPYILPHLSYITKDDIKKIGGKESLKKEQGFYIYRNRRLIIWGTWFRLENKHELTKLARIRVDIPNSLDYMWNIDIKKSSASLPDTIKRNLINTVSDAIGTSEKVHNYRGRKNSEEVDYQYIWERISNKERNGYDYKINREIPQIKTLKNILSKNQYKLVDKLLEHLEENFPVSTMYLDASKGDIVKENELEIDVLFESLKENLKVIKENGLDEKIMLKELLRVEPYCNKKGLANKIKESWGENFYE